jgi:hypothetical protein
VKSSPLICMQRSFTTGLVHLTIIYCISSFCVCKMRRDMKLKFIFFRRGPGKWNKSFRRNILKFLFLFLEQTLLNQTANSTQDLHESKVTVMTQKPRMSTLETLEAKVNISYMLLIFLTVSNWISDLHCADGKYWGIALLVGGDSKTQRHIVGEYLVTIITKIRYDN